MKTTKYFKRKQFLLSFLFLFLINVLAIFSVVIFIKYVVKDHLAKEDDIPYVVSSAKSIATSESKEKEESTPLTNDNIINMVYTTEDIKLNTNYYVNKLSNQETVVKSIKNTKEANMISTEIEIENIEIKEIHGDGWFKSYMDPVNITSKSSDQYKYKHLYTADENGLYKYKDMYVVAMSEKHFKVADQVIITFDDGVEIKCFIGDVKSMHDKNFNGLGHIHKVKYANGEVKEHTSIVEFFVDKNNLADINKKLGRVNKIISDGNVIEIKKIIEAN